MSIGRDSHLQHPISRRGLLKGAAGAGLVAGGAILGGRTLLGGNGKAGAQGRPNIVVFFNDEHRADALHCTGNQVVQTPNIDALAATGARFTRTWCQGPLCQPSRASFITGKYVHEHNITWNKKTFDQSWPTLMKQLQSAGYVTGKMGKTHFYDAGIWTPSGSNDLSQNEPWLRGFGLTQMDEEHDKYIHKGANVITPYKTDLTNKGLVTAYLNEIATSGLAFWEGKTSALSQPDHEICFVANKAKAWLNSLDGSQPFFLWVSTIQPHPPYIDDPTWASVYEGVNPQMTPSAPPPTPNNPWGNYLRAWMQGAGTTFFTPGMLDEIGRHYYGMISLIDQEVGAIKSLIDSKGWGDNTWYFLTADHGDMLGDHGMMAKNVFYRSSVTVPNIIRPAGGISPLVVDGLAQSIDITATILDVAGATPPTGARGRSLRPIIQAGGVGGREYVFSELANSNTPTDFFVSVRDGRWRYTWDTMQSYACELFDLESDPGEMTNLVGDPGYAGEQARLHAAVLSFLSGDDGPTPTPTPTSTATVTPTPTDTPRPSGTPPVGGMADFG